jgi:hypothetical protein
MTRACVQYVTGKDPLTGAALHVPRGGRERRLQKSLVRWKDPANEKLVLEALELAGRSDLAPRFLKALKASKSKRPSAARRPGGSGESLDLDTCG